MTHQCQQKQRIRRNSKYLESFITSKCSPDLLMLNMFPNSKEVTETWAMFDATVHLCQGYEWNNPAVRCIVVGDGIVPRTAAMFAFRTKWRCYSVDPELKPVQYSIERLKTYRRKIEDIKFVFAKSPVLIVMCHSHAKITDCLQSIQGKCRSLISMDCCIKQNFRVQPDVEYVDTNVWSEKNTIKIWRSV